jgi:hypothetical protein
VATLTDAIVGVLQAEPTLITLYGSGSTGRIRAFDQLNLNASHVFGLTPQTASWAFSGAKMLPVLIVRATRRQSDRAYQDEEEQEQSVRSVVRIMYMDDRANGYDTIEAAMGIVRAALNFKYFEKMRLEYQDDDLFQRTKEANNAATVNETYYAYGVLVPYTYG